jgi:hypothetical protein
MLIIRCSFIQFAVVLHCCCSSKSSSFLRTSIEKYAKIVKSKQAWSAC